MKKMQSEDHRQRWQPPLRPEWVQRINDEGRWMDVSGVVPLDEKSLLDSARRATGLSDFGSDEWREPFQILVKSLEEEAELNLMGRLRTRSEILQLLQARLQIEDWYKRHPEIDDEEIVEPIIIIGQGRSGTSFLNNVLAANPDNGALLEWEAMFPCPPPEKATYKTDPRIERADKLITQWVRVTPTLEGMHEFGGSIPLECCQIVSLSFLSQSWAFVLGQVSSYDAYIVKQDVTPGFEYHRRVLKLLQWRNPRRHWVLKDPLHLDRLALILKIYPDARFVWTHRDPVRALASIISLHGTFQWGRCDHPFKDASFDIVQDPDLSAARFNAVIDQLESGAVPRKQFHNLLYKDLVADTMGTLETMHRHLDIPLSDAGRRGMAQYLADNPRDARPSHKIDIGSDEFVAKARLAFKRYQDYFKVPNE